MIIKTSGEDIGKRLDILISEACDISRSAAEKLISDGNVVPSSLKKNYKIRLEGEIIEVTIPEPEPIDAVPEDIPLDIVYEDDDIIVINKAKGMVVHPAPGNERGTLVNALLFHCKDSLSGINGAVRPGIVHRIDKDTSGLLVCAKNDNAHNVLSAGLKDHNIKRYYEALVLGRFSEKEGRIDNYIGRDRNDRKRMAVLSPDDAGARRAITDYKVRDEYGNVSYCEFSLQTGRTHQIRVHMKSISHPIIGDEIYGGDKNAFYREHKKYISGQCLHAYKLVLNHPVRNEEMVFNAGRPEYFEKLLDILKSGNGN